ncbi:MAG TPA: hypothetical protein VK624_18905 [Steroidobacteraceae bacterium]|nr:hypothetical protein [Steroidobacteraceae bacterium]
MKHGLVMSFTLLLCVAAEAADAPKRDPAQRVTLPKPAAERPQARPPLNLRIGDIRKYMTPNEYLAAINPPDEERTTVVVEGAREPSFRLESELPVPGGLGSLWYAARNPAQSWRIFLPDVNAPALGPTYDKVPPPIFRWGP